MSANTNNCARVDEARTFEHRREAYIDFYVAVKAMARTAYGHGHSYGFTEPELREGWQDDAFAKRAHRRRAGCRWPVHGPRACALPGSRTAASGLADHPPQAAGRTTSRGPLPLRLSVSHWVGGPGRTPDHTKPITWPPRSDTITRHITARTPPANPVDLNIHRFLKVWTGSCSQPGGPTR